MAAGLPSTCGPPLFLSRAASPTLQQQPPTPAQTATAAPTKGRPARCRRHSPPASGPSCRAALAAAPRRCCCCCPCCWCCRALRSLPPGHLTRACCCSSPESVGCERGGGGTASQGRRRPRRAVAGWHCRLSAAVEGRRAACRAHVGRRKPHWWPGGKAPPSRECRRAGGRRGECCFDLISTVRVPRREGSGTGAAAGHREASCSAAASALWHA